VVGSQHQHHLQELGGVTRQAAAEPKKGHDTTDTNVVFEDIGNGHTRVQEFLTTVVGDGGNESGRFTDKTEFLGPGIVDGNLRGSRLGLGSNRAILDQFVINLLQLLGKFLECLGNVETGIAHGLILGGSGLQLGVGERTSVTELDFGSQQGRYGADGPRDDRLRDMAALDGLDHTVLLNTSDFAEQDKDLALGVPLVPQQVVNESGTGIAVTSDSDTLVHAVRGLCNDIVQLVAHTARLGHVADGSSAVELGGHDVVHHTAGVSDLEGAGLDATDGGGTDDGDALLGGNVQDLASTSLRDTLRDDGNGPDLGFVHQFQSAAIDGTRTGKIDDLETESAVRKARAFPRRWHSYDKTHGVNFRVLVASFVDLLINREESLGGSPVHFGHELTAEGVNDPGHGRGLALA
jgi:hypothetical protein